MTKLAIITSHPIPYQIPLFRELTHFRSIKTIVYFCSNKELRDFYDPDYDSIINISTEEQLAGYNYEFLVNWSVGKLVASTMKVNPSIVRKLLSNKYDAVLIHGYNTVTSWLALATAKIVGMKVILRGEVTLHRNNNNVRNVQNILKKVYFKCCDAIMYSCRGNREYFMHYGVSDNKLYFLPSFVDNEYFRENKEDLGSKKSEIQRKLKIDEKLKVILSVGRLIPLKKPMDILRSYHELTEKNKEAVLVFVGDGPERDKMTKYINDHGLNKVRITGYVTQKDIISYYAVGDLLVLFSEYDHSPKCINEAMNFKMPVIVSSVIGTAGDLVRDGVNGFIVPNGDIKILTNRIELMLQNSELRSRLGNQAFLDVSKWNSHEGARALVQTLRTIMKE